MPLQVFRGATLVCTFGLGPSRLLVLPRSSGDASGRANVSDATNLNIQPFPLCNSPANPQVAQATAAAGGIPVPAPCIPLTHAWIPTTLHTFVDGFPALANDSKCPCGWGGTIMVVEPGQSFEIIE